MNEVGFTLHFIQSNRVVTIHRTDCSHRQSTTTEETLITFYQAYNTAVQKVNILNQEASRQANQASWTVNLCQFCGHRIGAIEAPTHAEYSATRNG